MSRRKVVSVVDPLPFVLLGMFVTFASCGQTCMKIGLGRDKIPIVKSPVRTVFNVLRVMMRPFVLGGLALYVCSSFAWLLLISRVRLSVAYPMVSLSYVVVTLLSVFVLHEKVKWRYAALGLLFIALGVSFIGLGSVRVPPR